jgi:hypothetical protein
LGPSGSFETTSKKTSPEVLILQAGLNGSWNLFLPQTEGMKAAIIFFGGRLQCRFLD